MNNATEQIFLVNASNSQSSAAVIKIDNGSATTTEAEDFSNVCRTCATVTEFVIPIFEGEGVQNNLAEKIQKHLPIQVTKQDVLPRVVCYQCANTLLAWHELVQCCVQADVALRARVASRPTCSKIEPKSELNKDIDTSTSGQQQKKWACPAKLEPSAWGNQSDLKQYTVCKYVNGDNDNFDSESSPASTNEDDEPLSNLASKKTIDLYKNFYAALLNFKNHFVKEHNSDTSPETSDTNDSEMSENDSDQRDRDLDSYDDLSRCNMRKDRMDEEMRLELSKVQTKINGKIFYTCPTCGKNLSSSHTYVFHKRIHTGERPCVCHVCGKQFRAPNGLQRHLRETHERARRHLCRLCLKSFANSQNLKLHLRIHTGERPYVCADCGKRFTQSGSLHVHAKTHSGQMPHECAECGAKFRQRTGLTRHKLRHSGVRAHGCHACGRAFRLRHELTAHLRAHDGARPHACLACGATFRQRRALRHHAKRLHGLDAPPPLLPSFKDIEDFVVRSVEPPKYTPPSEVKNCVYCLTDVPDDMYKEHLVTLHSDFLFHCDECDTYVDRKEFLLHMSLHAVEYATKQDKTEKELENKTKKVVKKTGAKERGRKCYKRRSKSFNGRESAKPQTPVKKISTANITKASQENEFSDHSDAEGFGPLPESVFEAIEDSQDSRPPKTSSPTTEERASRTAEPNLPSPKPARKVRTCQICGKTYTAPSSYFYHMKHFHGQSRDHECATCGKKFGTKAALRQHEPVHTGACAYGCDRCGKRFRSKASLYIHEQTHGGEKRWSCAQCPRAFRWRAQLTRHTARHAGERAHACNRCSRRFAVRADLLRHARTHVPTPHACPHCGLNFAQLRYLKVHLHRKHSTAKASSTT